MKVNVSPSSPLPHYPNIFHDSVIPIESIRGTFYDDVNYDHTHNSWNVSFTSEQGEEKYFLLDPSNPLSNHSEETEGENFFF